MAVAKVAFNTPLFRIAFPSIFTRDQYDATQKPKYKMTMLFPKSMTDTELIELRTLHHQMASTLWPGVAPVPFMIDGDGESSKYAGFPGHWAIKASKAGQDKSGAIIPPPAVVGPDLQPITDPSVLYAGCYCIARLSLWNYVNGNKHAVCFNIDGIQKVRDGEPFVAPFDPNVFDAVQPPTGVVTAFPGQVPNAAPGPNPMAPNPAYQPPPTGAPPAHVQPGAAPNAGTPPPPPAGGAPAQSDDIPF